ncbi:MAG: T9SS type A sorting domain-containing protein [Flavicella sp.]
MKRHLYIFLLVPIFFYGQIVTLKGDAKIDMSAGSSIFIDGLTISSSKNLTIDGENTITRNQTPELIEGNPTIDRVYAFEKTLIGFQGILTFSYDILELNNNDKDDLVMLLQNESGDWKVFEPSVDSEENFLSHVFDSDISFKSISLISSTAMGIETLFEDSTFEDSTRIRVFPNPTTEILYIEADSDVEVEVFNTTGNKVMTTNTNKVDVSELMEGVYILKISNANNKTNTFKIVKK